MWFLSGIKKLSTSFFTTKGRLNSNKLRESWLNDHNDIYDYVKIRFVDSYSVQETIWRIKLHIEKRPTCPICGGKVNFYLPNKKNLWPFGKHCSYKCASKSDDAKEKRKNTCRKKYGTDFSSQSEIAKEKKKLTCIKKYGVDCVLKNSEVKEKIKNTCIKKYGYEIPWKNKDIIEKIKNTCKEKYGVDSYLKTQDYLEKQRITKTKNNSFNKSQPEDDLYDIILKDYPDVVRQYRSEKYPFCCDFYIPSKDLYIEFNGMWTHGGQPYIENDNLCIEKLNKWKTKIDLTNSDFYKKAIYVWTKLDVKKRNIAKENNLNYLEIWDLSEDVSALINDYFKN